MRQTLIVVIMILGIMVSVHGQSKPVRTSRPAPRPTANALTKPKPPQPKYLTASLDLNQTNLGQDFMGHDITAVAETIKNSPALKEKSEFESTSAFETRRAGFVAQPNGYMGFVVGEESITPEFKYDADSQTLAVTLTGSTERFIMDKDKPTLDGVLIRSIVRDEDSYIGSNAFGAKVEVRRTYSEEYGVVFNQDNWLFRSSERYKRKFTYLLPMPPDEARTLKADAKLLLVCRLMQPWFRHSAHGHDATIDEPYKTLIGDNYLQAVPEQLWIFNQRTGEVVRKLSESSITSEEDQQLNLKLRQTPLLLEVFPSRISYIKVTIDDEPEKFDVLTGSTKTFGARHRIVLTLLHPQSLSDITFKLNGKPYIPTWTKDATQIGSHESIDSATAVIAAP